jgi:hypothetical protein
MCAEYPREWIRGQLLNVERYTNGSFKMMLLGTEEPHLDFENSVSAQAFISWWYQREAGR